MLRVAFWNINTGKGSVEGRRNALAGWCHELDPDVLFLEEVSHFLTDSLGELTGMDPITNVETKDWKLQPSTKEIWALQRTGTGFEGRPLRLPGYGKAIRMAVKLTNKQKLSIWGLHANASSSGGRLAVGAAIEIVSKNPDAVVGGDFNRAFVMASKVTGRAVRCKSWQNNDLRFSQWRKQEGKEMEFPDKTFHLDRKNCGYLTVLPTKKGVIDFAIAGANRAVTPAQNCYFEETWVAILRYFDHCPVVFDIN